jgi:peroxiredoxin
MMSGVRKAVAVESECSSERSRSGAPDGRPEGGREVRWSARRKEEVVLRLLQGERLDDDEEAEAELDKLQRWHERIGPRGGTVLGIDVRDTSDDAGEFIDEYGLTYPHLKDGPGDTQDEYGVSGLPETFVIDRRGRIAAVKRGPVDDAFLERTVPPLLEER